jgi:YidC/Oxa1 family membrane protein insertase
LLQILRPIEYVVAWIMVGWHKVFTTLGMDPAGGWTWAFSIVGLVVVIRILLIPLFVKQIKAQRGLTQLQPEMKKIQEKYKNDRQKQSEAMMALYKETGTNPLQSCLPILAQAPIFFALFRVLNGIAHDNGIGPLTDELAKQAGDATIFGAPISASFLNAPNLNTKIVSAVLIVLMSLTTFTTQRQLLMKNTTKAQLDSPFARQQKMLMYVFPLVFAVSGVNFPIGVLIYWLTTNLWTMGQQFFVIARMPVPGTPAAEHLERKREAKRLAREKGAAPTSQPAETQSGTPTDTGQGADQGTRPGGQRTQPKRQARAKRATPPRNPAGSNPAGSNPAGSNPASSNPGPDQQT